MRLFEKLNAPWMVVLVLVLFLAVDGFLLYRYQQSLENANQASSGRVPLTGLEAPTTAEEATTSPKEEEDGVRVVVSVTDTPVGLHVLEDGQEVYDQVANPGFSEEFEGEEAINITAADAGAVRVEVNGQDLGSLGDGGVGATRIFTPEFERQ
jgi:cytoskeleton protein RodZ